MALVGSWSGPEQVEATSWTSPGVASGTFDISLAAGVLVVDYREVRDGALSISGHGVATETGWWWFDSYGFVPQQPGQARWSGDVLELDRTSPRGRTVMRLWIADTTLVCEMAIAGPVDDELSLMLSGRYERIPPGLNERRRLQPD